MNMLYFNKEFRRKSLPYNKKSTSSPHKNKFGKYVLSARYTGKRHSKGDVRVLDFIHSSPCDPEGNSLSTEWPAVVWDSIFL